MTHLNALSCAFGITRRFNTRELSHQPNTAGRLRKRMVSISKPASVTALAELVDRVAAEVVQVLVERAVERLHRRHEQHEMPAGWQHAREIASVEWSSSMCSSTFMQTIVLMLDDSNSSAIVRAQRKP